MARRPAARSRRTPAVCRDLRAPALAWRGSRADGNRRRQAAPRASACHRSRARHRGGTGVAAMNGKARVDGKFLHIDGRRLLIKGVTYGAFAPDERGVQFPTRDRVAADFAAMARHGINLVRTYTVPNQSLLDEAARHHLHV